MITEIENSPLIVVVDDDWQPLAGTTDRLVWSLTLHTDDGPTLSAPQFGIEVGTAVQGDDLDEQVGSLVKGMMQHLVSLHRALRELPDAYLNEVERIQIQLFERVVFPWFAGAMAISPGAWDAPEAVVRSATKGHDQLV